jgi:hypothetical protein
MVNRRTFLGSAGVAVAVPSAARPAVFAEVKPWNGKPTLHLNGRPVYSAFYALTDTLGGRQSTDELPRLAMAEFARIGFRLFQVDLFLEQVWPESAESLDLEPARRQIRGVLEVCPDAAVVIRWHLNAPRWWTARHPGETTRYVNGDFETVERTQPVRILMDDLRRLPRVSLASTVWREMATARTQELLRGLAKTEEGRALAGLHLACGVYGEWHYWGFMRNEPDSSAPMQAYFDGWRKARGRAPAQVPSKEDRAALDDGIFRDPVKREAVIDYYRAQQELVAGNIVHFCGVAKRAWPRPLMTGTFYGYFFSMFDRAATGGHLALQKVLASTDVDYLSAPQAYGDAYRAAGASGISRALVESARLHGKLFLDEMDQTPSWQWRNDVDTAFKLSDLALDAALIRRNVLTSFVRGGGLWFYDFGPANAAGWWNDTRLMTEIERLKGILERYHERPYRAAADVLMVFDTEPFYFTGSIQGTDPLTDVQAVNRTIINAWAAGAALETVHLADLERVDLDRFRLVVFANTWVMNAAQRRFVRERVMTGGRQVMFQGMPGYCDGRRLDIGFVRQVTGLDDLRRSDALQPFAPQFVVGDAPAPSGIVRRGATWFATAPPASPAAWRDVFRGAGAHLYIESGADIIHVGAGLVLLHVKGAGKRTLRFRSGPTVELDMPAASSWLFDAETGDRLL